MANPDVKGIELRKWARKTFSLSRDPPKSSMSAWLSTTVATEDTQTAYKTLHRAHAPTLESKLLQWIRKCEEWSVPIVSGPTMRVKAKQIHEGRRNLLTITAGYDKRDIYNLDETAYFYCTTPSKAVCTKSMPGRKKVKKRITVAVTSNADGSSKWPLLLIGTAKKPRCFGPTAVADMDFVYAASKKGWMTSNVFAHWVEGFNKAMHEQRRYVLLLLENASAHRKEGQLSNVAIHMLPANTTAFLQPQDAGIIQAFKARIGVLRATYLVEKFDKLVASADESDKESFGSRVNKLHEVSLVQALEWAKEAWQGVTQETIANCWRHTGILDEEVYELIENMRNL
ncbi:hypothetical protein DYB28_003682 [Aphanomyces astaci]|uniref:DDE-1 domain-containing protein n=1 Tax=Aphanomyces astaci TaxID=112090 RepID=A0A9X8DIX8_APHAT|nr:hypothetical protein DYB28_003682 [Aphanomyces astaci]